MKTDLFAQKNWQMLCKLEYILLKQIPESAEISEKNIMFFNASF